MQGDDFWFTILQGWEGVRNGARPVGQRSGQRQLTIVDVNGQTHVKTISYKQYYLAGDRTTGEYMIYFNGSAADLGFNLPGELAANDGNGAEGEAVEMYEADYAQGADEVFARGEWA